MNENNNLYDKTCTRCPLHQTARSVCVAGSGPLTSRFLLLTDGIGAEETGPISGLAGEILSEGLRGAGLVDQVRIESSVRCRTPSGRKPTAAEVKACSYYTQRVKALMPNLKVVVPLGDTPLQMFGIKGGVMKRAGIPVVMDWPEDKHAELAEPRLPLHSGELAQPSGEGLE